MYQNTKSATTAGLLGIFLGAFGAHNWYLGEKGKGIAHVCMMGGAVLVEIIAGAVLPSVLTFSALLTWGTILSILAGIAGLAAFASGIWGFVEGITILVKGDAGLAARGYAVATPVAPAPQPGYGVPQPGYGAPQGYPQGQYGYGPQPMPNQPMPGQPMPNQPYYGQQPMPGQPMPNQSYYGQQPMPQEQPMNQQDQPAPENNNTDGNNGQ